MDWKYLLPIFAILLLMGSVFSAPAVTATTPGTLINGTTAQLTFTLKDENPDANWLSTLKIYYSDVSEGYQYLIIYDTNVANKTGVVCTTTPYSDNNFLEARTCTYNWTVPNSVDAPAKWWYLDFNYVTNSANKNVGYKVSTGNFKIESVTGCGTFLLFAGLIAIVLVFYGVMQLLGRTINSWVLVALAVGIMIGVYIITSFLGGICVAV